MSAMFGATPINRLRESLRRRGHLTVDLSPRAAIAVSRAGDRVRVVRFVSPTNQQQIDLTVPEALRVAARLVAMLAGRVR